MKLWSENINDHGTVRIIYSVQQRSSKRKDKTFKFSVLNYIFEILIIKKMTYCIYNDVFKL